MRREPQRYELWSDGPVAVDNWKGDDFTDQAEHAVEVNRGKLKGMGPPAWHPV
jgi:hypothetical protein